MPATPSYYARKSGDTPMGQEVETYSERFSVGWGEIDGNQHMANRSYLDRAADVRFRFFSSHGYTAQRFAVERIGPAIVRDELSYRRELRLGDSFSVDLRARGLSVDGSRFIIENRFSIDVGDIVAVVVSEGVWFDLEQRKPRVPPPDLEAAVRLIPRANGFLEIPARAKRPG